MSKIPARIETFDAHYLSLKKYMQVPYELMSVEHYSKKELSCLARLVYIDMFNLTRLSSLRGNIKNDSPFIYYTKQTVVKKFDVDKDTASKVFTELINCQLIQIELEPEKSKGFIESYKVYVCAIAEYESNDYYNK